MLKRVFLFAVVLVMISCSESVSNEKSDTKLFDSNGNIAIDFSQSKETKDANFEIDLKINFEDIKDVKSDKTTVPDSVDAVETEEEWCSENGGFGCSCDKNEDCLSDFCIQSSFGQICTRYCVDTCPKGFECTNISTQGTDSVYICIEKNLNLCKPCKENSDCFDFKDNGNRCVKRDNPEEGAFCGVLCKEDADCPSGYVCKEVVSVDGENTMQCVPENGECVCTDYFIKGGFKTKCSIKNEYGECFGERWCTENGLTECNATVPEPEKCDSIDNNCNGQVDEDLNDPAESDCLKTGVCAEGVQATCVNGKWICSYDNVYKYEAQEEYSCDNLDNDCDGETDENITDVASSDCKNKGVCKTGVTAVCQAGKWICDYSNVTGYEDVEQTCDGLDNDCDGETDENVGGKICEIKNEFGTCKGNTQCKDGEEVCVGKVPQQEICNGEDDNCDGMTDEGFVDSDGDGIKDCVDIDDDNDGILDDGDGSGVVGDNPCKGGNTVNCDDNCRLIKNPFQDDQDMDGIGNLCDDDIDGDLDPNDTDCDPFNSNIHHNATEKCNGIDDNCNGLVDEENADGCQDYYNDDDNDKYADNTVSPKSRCLCSPQKIDGVNFSLKDSDKLGWDCNDSSSSSNPGAVEVCDFEDNDCDGTVDEENASGCANYYNDDDGDMFADTSVSPLKRCLCSPQKVSGINYNLLEENKLGDDCNDTDANINPQSSDTPETGKTFVDSNCDGIDGTVSEALFVSSSKGNDSSDCGTMNKPCKSITFGLVRAGATGKKYLVVAEGNYYESFEIKEGISIYGGYSSNNWERGASFVTNIVAQNLKGVTANNIKTKETIINHLKITGKDGAYGNSETTYALFITNCNNKLKLINVEIDAGNGGDGKDGESGKSGANGNPGSHASGSKGGTGGTSPCGRYGGSGGSAWDCGNSAGTSGAGGTAGGSAGKNTCGGCNDVGGKGGNGGNGANGIDGYNGSMVNSPWGSVDANGNWKGLDGNDGTDGTDGNGGGGGGAGGTDTDSWYCLGGKCIGGGGGGGGAGGCGGEKGKGGKAGGGSFGIFLYNAPIVIQDTSIKLGNGGKGGDGGYGGVGGAGGQGGAGGSPSCDEGGQGGNGGKGGNGGNGGAGSGACGGVSIGIGYKGSSPQIQNVSYYGGEGGEGGEGGVHGNGTKAPNGCKGKKANIHNW